MGVYVNPEHLSHIEWLDKHARLHTGNWPLEEECRCLLCLIQNPSFTALGVVYDKREIERFTRPEDVRIKSWYTVEKLSLREVVSPFSLREIFPEIMEGVNAADN
jgi:hypothetical protein